MKKYRNKFRIITAVMLLAVLLITPTLEVFANNSASGQTGIMNALNGGTSAAWPVTIPAGHTGNVTSVTLNLNISNGSQPLDIIITAPNGRQHIQRGVNGNNNITAFNNQVAANGTWTVAIRTTGLVSTATGRLTVNSAR